MHPLTSVSHCAKNEPVCWVTGYCNNFFCHGTLCSYCDSAELLRHQLVWFLKAFIAHV